MLKYNRGCWGKLNSLTAKNSTHKRIFLYKKVTAITDTKQSEI